MAGTMLFAASSDANAQELRERKERTFGLFVGGFASGDVTRKTAGGGVLGMEFKLVQSGDFVLGFAGRAALMPAEIPIVGGVNTDADAFMADLTVTLRIRVIATELLALVADVGGGARIVDHKDAMVDTNRIFEANRHSSGVVVAGFALEFRVNDAVRVAPYAMATYTVRQLTELNVYTSGPVFEDTLSVEGGVMVQFFLK